jgi:hypothetical protein
MFAQQSATENEIKRLVPYSTLSSEIPGLTLSDYQAAVRDLAKEITRPQRTIPTRPAPTLPQPFS